MAEINLPKYKGSVFHGAFGRSLNEISPRWFAYFYQQLSRPKPFVLLPPLDDNETYKSGHQFNFELTLFGEACNHYAVTQAAIEYLGRRMGLGFNRGKYEIIEIQTQHFDFAPQPDTKINNVTLTMATRLRLKHKNRLCRRLPAFSIFLLRLIKRLETLQKHYAPKSDVEIQQRALIEHAHSISIGSQNLKWNEWDRYSARQKSRMKFGGLLGSVSFRGDLEPFYPLLQLGEWLHVGNKTSFGLGKYKLERYQ